MQREDVGDPSENLSTLYVCLKMLWRGETRDFRFCAAYLVSPSQIVVQSSSLRSTPIPLAVQLQAKQRLSVLSSNISFTSIKLDDNVNDSSAAFVTYDIDAETQAYLLIP